ncbi:NnrS family protein [Albidovulum sediminicola]|uniref:NnrS family protein n=1 Tax=Albidovulum sediminicola TaxID=2984331 RepID=A0ABT2Z3V4_9RHOB|nr:NnrS family protein [Defluviimonas sp. WL0075]MCV2865824.1 NnrS family protein [Defluviimonas sp. WL0075]
MIKRLFSEGFRIFFLAACLFALAAMGQWEAYLGVEAAGGWGALPAAQAPHIWHAHEMIFGYGAATLGGFFLTAVPNWTGAKGAAQRFIALAFLVWLAGRLAMWGGASLPPVLVAAADLAFLPVLAAKIAAQLLARPKPQQLIFLLALGFLWTANLFCHLEWLGLLSDGVEQGLRAGLLTLIAMIVILGGRVTPGFTRNAMAASGREDRLPQNPKALAILSIAPALALPPVVLVGLPELIIGALAILAGAAALARLTLWRSAWTVRRPILWTLHLSYGLTGAGLLAFGLASLNIGSEIAALHLLGIGAVGGMTLSVLSRATLGHTGRPLVAPTAVTVAYVLMPLAALLRYLGGALPALHTPATLVAGGLWIAAFALVLAALIPAWLLPRAPVGRPAP